MQHLDELNEQQKTAVCATDGPLLVLAGAGAGKTRVIAHRILEIVRRGSEPESVLAITFTNKAAAEMRERSLKLLEKYQGQSTRRGPFISTFHSLGLQIIKEHTRTMGFKRTPTIFDRSDSLRQMKLSLKTAGAEDIEANTALSVLSRYKGRGIMLGDIQEETCGIQEGRMLPAWRLYEQGLAREGAVDFDDLLLKPVRFLKNNDAVRESYLNRWSHVHIDEYQDTNEVQAQFAKLLVGAANNICAVGDIDQTIYGWRGAVIENIIHFEKEYRGAQTVLLEQNYRSTQTILAAANAVISKNSNRLEKTLFTKNPEGDALTLYKAFDEMDEAWFIARKIKEHLEAGRQPRDMAVLYRANFQSRAIEEVLLSADIPYQVLGTRFFDRKEVKDTLSFIRAALYGADADINRIANVPPRGIGKVTLLAILSGREHELRGKTAEKVIALRSLLERIRIKTEQFTPSQLIRFAITESGIERMLKDDKIEGAERLENLRELVSLASRYDEQPIGEGLQSLLENIALASEQDALKEERNAIRLMTVHAAKGLEFPIVFIAGLEEGLFPYARPEESAADREEERRLMYVALTRAQRYIHLSFASYRTVFGSKNATEPSQFLADIPEEFIVWETPERLGKTIYLD